MRRNKSGEVLCSECGKVLKTSEPYPAVEGDGYLASFLKSQGFVVKNFLLFGDPRFYVFCNSECKSRYIKSHFSKQQILEVDEKAAELKEQFAKDIPKIQTAISNFKNLLLNHPEEFKRMVKKHFADKSVINYPHGNKTSDKSNL